MAITLLMFLRAPLTSDDLAAEFQTLGLRSGDNIIMHSSLKSIGPVRGGAQSVVDALLSVISPGNLMVPTFTYSLPGWKADPFDIKNSPSRTGGITEHIRLRPNAVRSLHPSHSVAVIGPDALELTRDHMKFTPLGVDSPFDRMRQRNASILMLGTGQTTNSTIHLCEVLSGQPYINVGFTENQDFELAWYLNEHEQVTFAQLKEIPGCSRGFNAVSLPVSNAGIGHDGMVGKSPAHLYHMTELVDVVVPFIREDASRLLCESYSCAICPRRRAFLAGRLSRYELPPRPPGFP